MDSIVTRAHARERPVAKARKPRSKARANAAAKPAHERADDGERDTPTGRFRAGNRFWAARHLRPCAKVGGRSLALGRPRAILRVGRGQSPVRKPARDVPGHGLGIPSHKDAAHDDSRFPVPFRRRRGPPRGCRRSRAWPKKPETFSGRGHRTRCCRARSPAWHLRSELGPTW
jgi:hypothetical protein